MYLFLSRLFICLVLIFVGLGSITKSHVAEVEQKVQEAVTRQMVSHVQLAYVKEKNVKPILELKSVLSVKRFLLLPFQGSANVQSQGFGQNLLAYGGMGMHGHPGIDWAIVEGTPILAAHDGVITEAFSDHDNKTDGKVGFGNRVRMRWSEGKYGYEIIAAHLSTVYVTEGQEVKQGDVIGLSGNTGFSTRPHLHFGIRGLYCANKSVPVASCTVTNMDNGYLGYVNPIPYMQK